MKPEYNVRHGIVRSKVEVDAAMEAKEELRHEEVPKPRAMQPSRFELVVDLVTANSMGLSIPQGLLFRADRVNE
jgi:hypothetical protein